MRKLSKRLQATADFVAVRGCVADIGTDHGYLPIYLVESGRCKRAIAMDVRDGPLKRASAHIQAANLEDFIQVRLSDGLRQLQEGEADSIVISGMGGLTLIRILTDRLSLLSSIQEFVLAPQSDIAKVRAFLRQHKLYIDRETLVYEDRKFYPIMHAGWEEPIYLQEHSCLQRQAMLQERLPEKALRQQLLDQYGEYLLYHAHPLLMQLLERDEAVKRKILYSLTDETHSQAKVSVVSPCSLKEKSCVQGRQQMGTAAFSITGKQQKRAQRRQELAEQLMGIQTLQQICNLFHT